MKSFRQHISDADSTVAINEDLSPFVLKASGIATVMKIKSQLSGIKSEEGKALASALVSLATMISLTQFAERCETQGRSPASKR